MIFTPEQRYKAEHGMDVDSSGGKRGSSRYRLWPNGVVVYAIQSTLGKFSPNLNH